MADIVQVTWTYRIALPPVDSDEYRALVERMFDESDAEDIAKATTAGGEPWTQENVRHQLAVWVVVQSQVGEFPCGNVEEDYDVSELGSTPSG